MKHCNVEVFSRVTGFFRPVQEWNKGKQAEFNDRKTFDVFKGGDNPQTPSHRRVSEGIAG